MIGSFTTINHMEESGLQRKPDKLRDRPGQKNLDTLRLRKRDVRPDNEDNGDVDPINEVSAAISIRPLLKPNELEPESDPVEFAIVLAVDLYKEYRESESKRLSRYTDIYAYRSKDRQPSKDRRYYE
jgi:hypothetical protein